MNISYYSIELEILTGGINLSQFSVELFLLVKSTCSAVGLKHAKKSQYWASCTLKQLPKAGLHLAKTQVFHKLKTLKFSREVNKANNLHEEHRSQPCSTNLIRNLALESKI